MFNCARNVRGVGNPARRWCSARSVEILLSAGVCLLSAGIAVSQPAAARAQEPPSKDQSALVDGLLDLLSEPVPARAPDSQDAPNQGPVPAQPDYEKGHELDPSLADHPLAIVGKNMRAAAAQLNKGVAGGETRQLQVEIVQRLDSLIEAMQQADPSQPSQPQSQQRHSSESQAPESSSSSQPQSAEEDAQAATGEEGDGQPVGSQSAQGRPSQAGPAADVIVDLADPERLQQDVWGQLPEQVRQQMQSRMVERFLPSYREQIEAYFRALLQSEQR